MIVLVVGTGRCGTSTVARLLQEECGVFMCQQDRQEPSAHNPQGFYEEKAFGDVFKQCTKEEQNLGHLQLVLQKLVQQKVQRHKDWGLKSNLLAYFLPMLLQTLPEKPIIIRCHRDVYATAYSWARVFGVSLRDCIHEINSRVGLLDMWLEGYNYMRIDFTERVDEGELLGEVRGYLGQEWTDAEPFSGSGWRSRPNLPATQGNNLKTS